MTTTPTAKHTPGPVSIKKSRIKDGEWGLWSTADEQVAACQSFAAPNEANAARLAACWSACDGINPEAVPDMLTVCKAVLGEIDIPNLPAHFRKGGHGAGGKVGVFLSAEQIAAVVAVVAKATEATP